MTRAPQRRRDALIEHPADRQLNDALAEAFPGKLAEPLHGGEILRETRREELRGHGSGTHRNPDARGRHGANTPYGLRNTVGRRASSSS